MQSQFKRIAQKIVASKNVLFITGAGISADSGLPTYRGTGGLYAGGGEDGGGLTEEGFPIEEALSRYVMESQPKITWKYLIEVGKHCGRAEPNKGHLAIAKLCKLLAPSSSRGSDTQSSGTNVYTLTQNIDGLHRKALETMAVNPDNPMVSSKLHAPPGSTTMPPPLIEIHGSIWSFRCTKCSAPVDARSYGTLLDWELLHGDGCRSADINCYPPVCKSCSPNRTQAERDAGLIRPNVVLFDEMLPVVPLQHIHLLNERIKPEVVISVGTTNMFPYITEPVARAWAESSRCDSVGDSSSPRLTVNINPQALTEYDGGIYNERLAVGASTALLGILEEVERLL